jgi:dihydroflavonol-4-reductase
MKALVTGATGFVGSHVALALLRHGWEVRALVRPSNGGQRRAELAADVEMVAGDVEDEASVERAAQGCQALFHVAAMYELWAREPRRFYEVNVGGTRAVLEGARKAGVERVVHTSSVATVLQGGDEAGFADPETAHGHYKRSKILAERVAFEYPNVVVVNPAAPMGWGDVRPTPTGNIVLGFLRGRMPAYIDTGLNVIDVEDVGEGHVLAYERGEPGERYILGNENLTLQALLKMLAVETGRHAPWIKLPMPVAYAAAAISEIVEGRLAQHPPTVTLDAVRMAQVPMYYDSTRARRELGLPQTPVHCALRKSAEWFMTHGYC